MTIRLALSLQLATASVAERTVVGVATFYGRRAHANYPLIFHPGSLRLPDPLSRVKLCLDHDTARVVGYLVDAADSATQLDVKGFIPETPAGDAALVECANGLRDGLSVGVDLDDDGYYFDDDGYLNVTGGLVREITLTGVPAFDDARLSDVVASLRTTTTTKGTPMKCQTCGKVHATDVACTAPASAAASAAPAPVQPAPAPAVATIPTTAAPTTATAAAIEVVERGTRMSLRAAAALVADTLRRGGSANDLRAALGMGATAALADVVPANDAGAGLLRPQWVDELWKASKAERPFIDTLGPTKPLTGIKVEGWQWDVAPVVVDYPGNKTEVTGNQVTTKPVDATAERVAGGWDVDRMYVDLGSPGMIEALFAAAVEDYKRKSEAKVAAKLIAGASSVTGQTSLPAALTALGFAAAQLGARISAVGFGADVWAGFTQLTRDEVPWWMGSGDSINLGTADGTVGGMRLFSSPDVAATQVVGLDARAATVHEVDPPVRVQAVDIARGGVDLALFGYVATIINDARAIIKTTVTPPLP